MKLFHISDLHIGKQLYAYSLREEQEDILHQIVEQAAIHRPDAILIAGDIYDKSVPSGEAYEIFDHFLNEIASLDPQIPVCMIAGNHDSALRLKYASSFLERQRIVVSPMIPTTEEEHLRKVILQDEYGEVAVYLLPFLKPGQARVLFPGQEITDYDMAVRKVLEREEIDFTKRNILVAHQFFVGGNGEVERCDSELMYLSVGGIDSVHTDMVEAFDYVALGHIHGEQPVGEAHIRYSGTPLKYSVSEEHHEKGITMVTLGEKGDSPKIERIPLRPLRDVCSLRGTLEEVIQGAEAHRDDYVSIVLTDETGLYRPKDQLDECFDRILEVRIENTRTMARMKQQEIENTQLSPLEAFREFYQMMNDQPMSEEEELELQQIIAKCDGSKEG